MRISLVFLLLFCCSAACWAQQDSSKVHKHEIGFNTGTSLGATYTYWRFSEEQIFFSKIRPVELCYKRHIRKNNFFRLSAGVWTRMYSSIPDNDKETIKFNSSLFTLGLGYEKRKTLSQHFRLAVGADIVLRRMFSVQKRSSPIGNNDTRIRKSEQEFYNAMLSPFTELHYLLGKRFLLAAQANLRVGYLFGGTQDSDTALSANTTYRTSEFSLWLLQVSPMANVALYYSF
ncbi:MAG: hypothetical protein EAZ57_04240 [Cytophagales bacterium]|nr:MAG: hypothetical protein EAZ67_05260 [Cytophagales bacterium]TAF61208.1 MAG: hypothetical protein EAZ57_04240 [Cytophagales bacterium]